MVSYERKQVVDKVPRLFRHLMHLPVSGDQFFSHKGRGSALICKGKNLQIGKEFSYFLAGSHVGLIAALIKQDEPNHGNPAALAERLGNSTHGDLSGILQRITKSS